MKLDISQYPKVLTVHHSGPGRFSIRLNGAFTAKYPETDKVKPKTLRKLGKHLGPCFANEEERQALDRQIAHLKETRTYLLELVIGRLVASGRGGTLLFNGSNEADYIDCNSGTRVKKDFLIQRHLGALLECNGFKPEAPYRLRDLAQLISEIASVDGATEITRDVEIVRYGAKTLTKKNYMEKVEKACDPETYKWLKPRGTRHRSAAYWVVAEGNPRRQDSRQGELPLALVVSADGEANMIFWEDKEVRRQPVVYRRL